MQSASNQQTQEWHEQRALKVTGSRIGAILGHSPWTTREDVMREFIKEHQGLPREDITNVAMQWGIDHEQVAIDAYEADSGNLVSRSDFVEHPDLGNIIGVSPDGIVDEKILIEVKCPYSKKVPSGVPDHYIDQVQLSMEVLDLEMCEFVYWTPDQLKTFHVERDRDWFKATLPIIYEFFEEFESRKDEELIDFVNCDSDEAIGMGMSLIECRKRIKKLQEHEKTLVADLKKFVDEDHDTVIGKLYANHVTRKGSIAWKQCYQDHPEIEKVAEEYRKPDITYIIFEERD